MSATNTNRQRLFLLMLILGTAATVRSQAQTDAKEAHLPPNVPRSSQLFSVPGAQIQPTAGTQAEQANASTPPIANYRFVNINVANSNWIQANGVNNAGQVVGWYQDSSNTPHGFVWQKGVLQTLDYPGSTGTHFNGINNRGVVIGAYFDFGFNWHAFTYTLSSKSWTELPAIPDYSSNLPAGINDDGEATGYAGAGDDGPLAWIWNSETQSYSFFTVPGAQEADTFPTGINNANQIVGIYYTYPHSDFPLGFLKEECPKSGDIMYVHIHVPGALTTSPSGINNKSVIVGTFQTGYGSAGFFGGFLRTPNGAFQTVNDTSAAATFVQGVNDDKILCGYTLSNQEVTQAFVAYPQ